MNKLFVNIIGQDCTNGGATSGHDHAMLYCESGPVDYDSNLPLLAIVEHNVLGRDAVHRDGSVRHVHAAPIINGKPVSGMFGGNYVISSDSRFPFETPIPVHDRFETREEQQLYSA